MQKQLSQHPANQRGMILIISLIMLMVVTMIGLSSTRISSLEVIMGANTQNTVESLIIAEDSALAGEIKVSNEFGGAPTINLSENSTDGFYIDADIDVYAITPVFLWSTDTVIWGGTMLGISHPV